MSLRNPNELPEPARGELRTYLATVDADVRPDVEAHLLDRLAPSATLDDVRRVIEELGPLGPASADGGDPGLLHGTWLGMPYDLRVPSLDKVRAAWWDPANPRIFVPRVFGGGWDLNFGGLAVRAGLIEPDAEDSPLALVPRRTLGVAQLIPVGLAAAIALSFLARRRTLPARVPTKWTLGGRVRRTATPARAVTPPLLVATGASAASSLVLARHRPTPGTAVAVSAATVASALAATSWAQTLLGAGRTRLPAWVGPLAAVIPPGATFAMLVTLARAGRRAEIGGDLR